MTAPDSPTDLSPLAEAIWRFGRKLRVPEGDLVGQPFRWRDFQVAWLRDMFPADRVIRQIVLSVARKNGKTAFVAILVLAALIGPLAIYGSGVYSASRSRKQAAIVYRYCRKMIRLSGLDPYFHCIESGKTIRCKHLETEYHALSADADTNVGEAPRLLIHDELGRVIGPRDRFYEATSTGLGAYSQSLEIIISTQAEHDEDLFSVLLDSALSGVDPGTVGILHTAPADCPLDDEDAWAASNPALDIFRDRGDLAARAAKAMKLPGQEPAFRNLNLNQRVTLTAGALFKAPVWATCQRSYDASRLLDGRPVTLGLDLSQGVDLTAAVAIAPDPEWGTIVWPWVWTPEDPSKGDRTQQQQDEYDEWIRQGWLRTLPGAKLGLKALALDLLELTMGLTLERVAYDPRYIDWFRAALEEIAEETDDRKLADRAIEWADDLLEPHGQGFVAMTPAIDHLEELVLEEAIAHPGSPALTSAVLNATVVIDGSGNRRLMKNKSPRKIDAAMALCMGAGARSRPGEPEGLLASEGLVIV